MSRKVAILLTSCDYERSMSTLMLANAHAMLGDEVHLFLIFRGVRLARRGFRSRFPGLLAPLTAPFERRLARTGIGTFREQFAMARELGVHIYVCDLCVQMGLLKRSHLVEGVEVIGIPRFAEIAGDSDVHFAL